MPNRFLYTPCFLLLLAFSVLSSTSFAQDKELSGLLKQSKSAVKNGFPDSALLFADSALAIAKTRSDSSYIIRALGAKASALTYLNQDKEAGVLYFEALRMCHAPKDDAQLAFLYNELGYLCFNQRDFSAAKNYFRQELVVRERLNDPRTTGHQLLNLASIHRQLKEYDSAAVLLDDVRKILATKKDTLLEAPYYNARGTLFHVTGRLDSARFYYRKAETIWESMGNPAQLFRVIFNRAELEAEQKNTAEALVLYLRSDSIAMKSASPGEQAMIKSSIAEIYAALGNYNEAYSYRTAAAGLNDSIRKAGEAAYIARLDRQFQAEKNRQTIQEQQLQLEKQQSRTLLVLIIGVVAGFAFILLLIYFRFRQRVQKQVEAAKTKFFSNIVHEIRTPLSMIQAPVMELKKNNTDPEQQAQLQLAERNITRLNELINQMLDISKLDAAKYRLNESFGDLAAFISELLPQFEARAKQKQLGFHAVSDLPPTHARFDRDALEKIISNLVDNAIKYTPRGGDTGLDISAEEKNGRLIFTLEVWDTGVGIPEEEQEEIFSRFYRAEEQQQAGTKGAGIGLSLVRELITLMNGTIQVLSRSGQGAVFSVRLSFGLPGEAETVSASGDETLILLAEDDADILAFNTHLLEKEGYRVTACPDGVEAAKAIGTQLPDLVITDLMMPGKDGITLLKEMRAQAETEHIPVIILSAKAAAETRIEGAREGAQVYLPKPFVPDELLALVKSQLDLLRRQRQRYQSVSEKEEQTLEERFAGNDPFTRQFFALVIGNLDNSELTIEQLAERMHINRSHFQRKMKTLTGYSPSELLRIIRLEKAIGLLLAKKGNVTEVAYQCGFTSQSYFSKCFVQRFGYAPSEVGKG